MGGHQIKLMKISFVVPAYNEELYIEDCLRALVAATADKPYATEIVVVNNASTDRTAEVARRFPEVRVVDEPQKGVTRARQKGFESTTGEFVANIDSDVRIPAEWLDRALASFAQDPRLACLSGPFIYYDLSPITRAAVKAFYFAGVIFYRVSRLCIGRGAMVQGGNFILRRSSLQEIGGFDTGIEFFGEDTDIGRRASAVGRVEFLFGLRVFSSGRRLKHFGLIQTGIKYALNFLWVTLFAKPLHTAYTDIRLPDPR